MWDTTRITYQNDNITSIISREGTTIYEYDTGKNPFINVNTQYPIRIPLPFTGKNCYKKAISYIKMSPDRIDTLQENFTHVYNKYNYPVEMRYSNSKVVYKYIEAK